MILTIEKREAFELLVQREVPFSRHVKKRGRGREVSVMCDNQVAKFMDSQMFSL